jgi:enterochelin esterase-like enzyme
MLDLSEQQRLSLSEQRGSVEDVVVQSAALGRDVDLKVILPPGYSPGAGPYPVLYFLHPWGLSPRYITDKLNVHLHLWHGVAAGWLPPMVVVLPTGGKSFFIDAADPPGHDWSQMVHLESEFFRNALDQYGDYGAYLRGEVIPFVEDHYAVRPDGVGRAIGGISMGGAGAAIHAFNAPDQFSAVGLHSPALVAGPPENGGPTWIFGLDPQSIAERNPADVARRLVPERQPRIYLDCAEDDPLIEQVRALHRVLDEGNIRHEYVIEPGRHDKTYWEPRIARYLAFYARDWLNE